MHTPPDPNGDHMPESSPEAATPHDDARPASAPAGSTGTAQAHADDAQRVLDRADAVTPPRTLVDVLRATVAAHPDASAIEDGDGALSYRELMARVVQVAASLRDAGVGKGDRVGIRMPSGSRDLYVTVLGVLAAGAAYVPVDADDPEERARLVFGEARVAGVVTGTGEFTPRAAGTGAAGDAEAAAAEALCILPAAAAHASTSALPLVAPPAPEDDAWIIFTSGSTGTPKGVAVSHRSAAAFVDAEARLFLQQEPIGPGDRVLAGLSVAFDASCEEMWLAWRHGACLVPAPRSLVRSGMDLGPWLTTHGVTIVSTVPTLAALWPAESLENVRLLIFGGEACPPELGQRLATDGREVWNTYGPTEATVVACAAPLGGPGPVRIGLPLDGWDLAVVDPQGARVPEGGVGELIIGGVGLARYLDPAKDAEKYAPFPALGWDRAYRSGDLVRFEAEGLVFQGRADDQVKVGGRRIELGEIEAALQDLDDVQGAAVAVQTTGAGNQVLVGYLVPRDPAAFSREDAVQRLRVALPAALVPLIGVVESLPTRTSGKVDKAALPWPLPGAAGDDGADLDAELRPLAEMWSAALGTPVASADANFFDLGGGSLSAAQLVARIRTIDPEFTVADVYAHPRLGAMHAAIAGRAPRAERSGPRVDVTPTPRRTQWIQTLLGAPLLALQSLRWLALLLTGSALLRPLGGFDALPSVPLWLLVPGLLLFATPFGRMAISAVAARLLLRGLEPGDHPRGGRWHLRIWLAEQIAQQIGAVGLAGAPWITYYARALGARIADDVDLHTLPPVTGMLRIGRGASVEPEVDLSGYWIDGDTVRVGAVRIGAGSTVGTRSTLLPGTRIGKGAEIAPGSAVFGRVPAGQRWAGSPAAREGKARVWWPDRRPPRNTRWVTAYGAASVATALVPVVGFVAGGGILAAAIRGSADLGDVWWRGLGALVPAVLMTGLVLALLVVGSVRLLGLGVTEGIHAVRSRVGWQLWTTERLLDLARTVLFPLYAGPLHARVAAPPRRARGQGRGGVDRAPHPRHDHHPRRRLPRRRHARGRLRARRRVDARRARRDRPARVPRQLRHGRPRPQGAEGRPRGGALGGAHEVEGRVLVARLPARPAPAHGRRRRRLAHVPAADAAARGADPLGAAARRARLRHLRHRPRCPRDARRAHRVLGSVRRVPARRRGAAGRRRGGGGHLDGGEVDPHRPHPRGGAPAVVVVRVAQRGVGRVHRDGRGALVRVVGGGHARARVVAAEPRGTHRIRRLVRLALAARGRPRDPRRRIHDQPRMCRPDASVP